MPDLKFLSIAASCLIVAGAAQAAPGHSTVDFSQGSGGWKGIDPNRHIKGQGTWVDSSLGNQAPALHSVLPDSFGAEWSNTRRLLTGDYSALGAFSIGLDVNAYSILNLANGLEVSRDLVIEFIDSDTSSGVWFNLGSIAAGNGWQHLGVTISDTASAALPAGWQGLGAETDDGSPTLPTGISFADVLKGVDKVVLSTYVPGYFYGDIAFDVALDNIAITAVPEPGTVLMQGLGLAMLAGVARRRRATRP